MPYPPIYIINLKRTPERKLFIQRQLNALNLNYQFVEAIDKYDLGSKAERAIIADQLDIDTTNMETLNKLIDNSRLACLLSHIKVYNLIIEKNIPYTCVLEDDAYLLPDFSKILITAQQTAWDVLMLSNQSHSVRKIILELHTSMFHSLYKLICYKKHYPELTFFTVCLMTLKIIKLLMLRHKMTNKISAKAKYIKNEKFIEYMACEIGALPNRDRQPWHKVTPNHHITTPEISKFNATSGMAYMLTHSAATKWKQAAISLSKSSSIDRIPFELYKKKDLKLYIVLPPCVNASYQYLVNSAHCY